MRFLVDENMHYRVVAMLRAQGHDVLWAGDSHRSAPDTNLLELATRQQRTLITYDKDFGDLIYHHRMAAPHGVLLFRLHNDVPDDVKEDFVVRSATVQDVWPSGLWTIQIRHHP